MFVEKVQLGRWIEVTPKGGPTLRLKVFEDGYGKLNLAFDDPDRDYTIRRERGEATAGDPPSLFG